MPSEPITPTNEREQALFEAGRKAALEELKGKPVPIDPEAVKHAARVF